MLLVLLLSVLFKEATVAAVSRAWPKADPPTRPEALLRLLGVLGLTYDDGLRWLEVKKLLAAPKCLALSKTIALVGLLPPPATPELYREGHIVEEESSSAVRAVCMGELVVLNVSPRVPFSAAAFKVSLAGDSVAASAADRDRSLIFLVMRAFIS